MKNTMGRELLCGCTERACCGDRAHVLGIYWLDDKSVGELESLKSQFRNEIKEDMAQIEAIDAKLEMLAA